MTEWRPATHSDPEIHSGDEVFSGTRVPVAALGQVLLAGGSTQEFLSAFPSVEPWQVESVIRQRLPVEPRPRESLVPERLAEASEPFFPPSVYIVEKHYGLVLEAFLDLESALAEPGVPPLNDPEWKFLFDLSGEAIWVHESSDTRIYEMPIIASLAVWAVEQARDNGWCVRSLHWSRETAEQAVMSAGLAEMRVRELRFA